MKGDNKAGKRLSGNLTLTQEEKEQKPVCVMCPEILCVCASSGLERFEASQNESARRGGYAVCKRKHSINFQCYQLRLLGQMMERERERRGRITEAHWVVALSVESDTSSSNYSSAMCAHDFIFLSVFQLLNCIKWQIIMRVKW